MTSSIRIVFVLALTACAVDGEDLEGDLSEETDAEADAAAEQVTWTAIELEGVPTGNAIAAELPDAAALAAFPCRRDFACLFNGQNGTGTVVGVRSGFGLPDLRQLNFNDKASSWRNRAGRRYCWFRDIGFNGPAHVMAAGRQANITGAPNNEASSYAPCN